MKPFRVGLTGGLASGKSTVAALLSGAGFKVVDADELVAKLYRTGRPGALAVAAAFGGDYLDAEGAVDKRKVAALVFADEAARRKLEEAIHPLVRETFRAMAAAADVPVVLEATRLVEAGYAPDFDLIVTVEAPEELRLERAMARATQDSRTLSREEAVARLNAQGDGAKRREVAHRMIWNVGTPAELEEKVERLVVEIRRRAAEG